MVLTSASVPRESQQTPAPLTDTLRLANESLSHMVWVIFKLRLLVWVLEQVSLCLNPLRAESPFTPAQWLSWI